LKRILHLATLAASLLSALGSNAAQAASGATFTKITTGSVVTDVGASWAAAWVDYDGDGWLDLFVTNGDYSGNGNNVLYHNNGDGSFTPVTDSVVGQASGNFRGCAWVDWNNDGYPDLSVVSIGTGNYLYQNNGDGTFTQITDNIIVNDSVVSSTVIGWSDFNRDGYLDCAIGNWDGNKNFLYRNLGDGTFSKVTQGAIATDPANAGGMAWVDYNNDGWPDLFLPNFQGPNLFYRNSGAAGFIKLSSSAVGSIITDAARAGGCAWGDYDNDGYPDVYLTSLDVPALPGLLYHNNGDGSFTRVTDPRTGSILTEVTRGGGCAWADYDNDGYLDLFVTRVGLPNLLFHNNGDGTFTKIATGAPVEDNGPEIQGWGPVWGDYNNDGFLDLYVANGGGGMTAVQSNFLYRNDGNSNGWIKIRCEGTASNRSGIGAKVRVKAVIGGKQISQLREISHGTGWNSSPLEAYFGLGDATNISTIQIEWPSGTIQAIENVPTKQSLVLKEPARLSAAASGQVSVSSWIGQRFQVENSLDLRAWSAAFSLTNTTGSLQFTMLPSTNRASFFRVRAQ
jgi:hypothetical protein